MQTVSLFIPCIVDVALPSIGEATVLLLRHLGLDPVYHREQTCCGQPAYNAGFRSEASRLAKHFIEIFENDDVIVSPSGSCLHTVKYHYPELFKSEPEVVQSQMTKRKAIRWIARESEERIPAEDRARFIEVVETELSSLHEGNIARYKLRPSEFETWYKSWK